MKLVQLQNSIKQQGAYCQYTDHFTSFNSGDEWTSILTDSGTCAVIDGHGGILQIEPSDGTVAADDQSYFKSTKETFLFQNNKPFYVEAMLKVVESNTDDAHVMFGLADAVAAEMIVDATGEPKTSFSGAVFYKVKDGTNWKVATSLSTTQTKVELTAANSLTKAAVVRPASAYGRVGIGWQPLSSTTGDIMFYVDGVLVYRQANFVYTSATEMNLFGGIKNGANTNHDKLLFDYVAYSMTI